MLFPGIWDCEAGSGKLSACFSRGRVKWKGRKIQADFTIMVFYAIIPPVVLILPLEGLILGGFSDEQNRIS